MRSTRMTAVVAGVVMMAGLTACNGGKSDNAGSGGSGGSGAGQSPLQVALASLKTAAQQTGGKKSAEVDGTLKNATSTASMKGAMDWSQGMRMNLDIKQSAGMLAGRPTKAVYTSDAMYMNMGMPMGGKSWVKYDYDVLAKKMGPAGALIKDQMNNNNPTRAMELLIASGKVKEAGKEDVRGVQATHYTGTLSISELTRMQSKNVSESDMKALEQQLKTSGAGQEAIDLWISSDNLLVKKREHLVGGKLPYDSTVFYSNYGTKVPDQTPAAGDTVDFDKVGKP
ncbi:MULTISPECIES: hypothetical protein [Streptomyces]|nr:hypothetical protein [Streptomyces sp. 9-7]